MLSEGDLLPSELDDMWSSAVVVDEEDTIDVEGFVKVYNDIDDLFEDEDDDEEESMEEEPSSAVLVTEASSSATADDETELTRAFTTLTKQGGSATTTTTITLEQLQQWEEITSLVSEGMLAMEEVKSLWDKSGEGESMDLARFVKFNDALDDLFEFDDEDTTDDEEDDEELEKVSADLSKETEQQQQEEEEEQQQPKPAQLPIITETDLPPAVLFSQLANENYQVGQDELNRWGELQEMIAEGELSREELDVLIGRVVDGTDDDDGYYLDEEGFCALAEAIDDLFEDVDDDEESEQQPQQEEAFRELKEELLELLEDIDKIGEEEGRLLCGLDCNELEQERVLEVVADLERESYNKVVAVSATGGGAVNEEELIGEWELLYSSSSTMKYNEGLSGLAGGLTRFGGLKQKIIGTKYLSDVEYTEQVIGKLGGKSFEVKITGDWELKTELSLFTGKPANVMSVTPDSVSYGPRRDKADHWKSLGPMNMLLLSYIDEDLRIMRGNTSTDTLFIWRRC